MNILLARRSLMPSLIYETPLIFISDGVIHYPFTIEKSGTNSSFNTDNGCIQMTTRDNSTSAYSRVRAVSDKVINMTPYKTLKVIVDYTNNTYGASIFQVGVGIPGESNTMEYAAYTQDERRTAAANDVELTVDLTGVSGKKQIGIYNTTVQASTQQGGKYTIKKVWLE